MILPGIPPPGNLAHSTHTCFHCILLPSSPRVSKGRPAPLVLQEWWDLRYLSLGENGPQTLALVCLPLFSRSHIPAPGPPDPDSWGWGQWWGLVFQAGVLNFSLFWGTFSSSCPPGEAVPLQRHKVV